MPIGAGRRDRKVTFERAAVTQDGNGEEIEAWAPLGSELANILYGTGAERRQAAMEQGQQALTIRTLATDTTRGVTLKDRVLLEGEPLDLVGISPIGRLEMEFTAIRAN